MSICFPLHQLLCNSILCWYRCWGLVFCQNHFTSLLCESENVIDFIHSLKESRKHKLILSKCFIYCSLLLLFVKFYIINSLGTYIKGRTTFSSTTDKMSAMDVAYLVFCMNPAYKASNHKYSEFLEVINGSWLNLWTDYQNLVYNEKEDSQIKMWIKGKTINHQTVPIVTFRNGHGMCFVVQHEIRLSSDIDYIWIELALAKSLGNKVPEGLLKSLVDFWTWMIWNHSQWLAKHKTTSFWNIC